MAFALNRNLAGSGMIQLVSERTLHASRAIRRRPLPAFRLQTKARYAAG